MIIISSNNVGNRVDGASGFEIKHFKIPKSSHTYGQAPTPNHNWC